jgi:hypothetical protein
MTSASRSLPLTSARHLGAAWPWWLATSVYFAAGILMHLRFSLWLVQPRELPLGLGALSDLLPAAIAVGALLLAATVFRQLQRSPTPRILGSLWLLLGLVLLAIDRFLTFSAAEYFHYPQYALLAWLMARTLDPDRTRFVPGRVLFWTTLLGATDEMLQYLWITAGYSHYFDFNDVLVNLVAAAIGVLVYYGSTTPAAAPLADHRWPLPETVFALMLALAIGAGFASERLQVWPDGPVAQGGLVQQASGRWTLYLQRGLDLYGRWQPGPYRGHYYVLQPLEGLLAITSAGMLVLVAAATSRWRLPVRRINLGHPLHPVRRRVGRRQDRAGHTPCA